ncbi:MAG: SUMF1/EgtB/PvdO family nonheme iron enzyme [Hyphomicrobiaceae bacterium]
MDTILSGDYRIRRVIGSGGFGITYEAEDLRLRSAVALKEYYPVSFGERDATMSVRPKSERHKQPFEWGRSSFLEEARMLARFKHPSIVRVARVFEANQTAYMVMDFEDGQNLEVWLQALDRPPIQEELDRIVAPLLDALDLMHRESFLHRDIAPDNIIIRANGSPVLLDFGAARRAVADMTGSLTGIIKAGYSPHEQYASNTRLQGPWSDIYALGATLYRAVAGQPPNEATNRVEHDALRPASLAATGKYRPGFLAGIDACLRVKQAERPQSVAQLRPILLAPQTSGNVRRMRWPAVAAIAAIAAGVGYYGWYAVWLQENPHSRGQLAMDEQQKVAEDEAATGADEETVRPDKSTVAAAEELRRKLEQQSERQQAEEKQRADAKRQADDAAKARAEDDARRKEASQQPPTAAESPKTMHPGMPIAKAPMTVEQERALPPQAMFRDCDTCPEVVVVSAGAFFMGSPEGEPGRLEFEGPVHRVSFPANFAVGRHAVTRDEFKAFVDATGYRFGNSCHAQTPTGWVEKAAHSFLAPPGFKQDGRHPAVCVSWEDADAYAQWLARQTQKPYRLLTEAEREYITRAGTATPYWWGVAATPDRANFDTKPRPRASGTAAPDWEQKAQLGVAAGGTRAVDTGPTNPWGFGHVHGNAAEWVQDCWSPNYKGAPADGSARLAGDCSHRVVRGGAWSSWPEDIRAGYREMGERGDRYYSVGFRVARDLGK